MRVLVLLLALVGGALPVRAQFPLPDVEPQVEVERATTLLIFHAVW